MSNTWMLDVLADLKAFADQNGMPRLADGLVETVALAEEELGVRRQLEFARADETCATDGNGPGRFGASAFADGTRG